MCIECKCRGCKYCFEGDCQLVEVKIDNCGLCESFEQKDDKNKVYSE